MPSFHLRSEGEESELGATSSRLLAIVGLESEPIERNMVAALLWPCVPDSRSLANLRTALWRIGQYRDDVLTLAGNRIGLGAVVEVDHRDNERLARRILGGASIDTLVGNKERARAEIHTIINRLTAGLLTNWYDDWLGVYQERWRQLRLHSLDALSLRLTEVGFYAAAIDAATAAVATEPLRESGYRSLMTAHLAEGNVSEAIQTHERYRALLESELGIAPSLHMYELLKQASGTVSAEGRTIAAVGRHHRPPPTRW